MTKIAAVDWQTMDDLTGAMSDEVAVFYGDAHSLDSGFYLEMLSGDETRLANRFVQEDQRRTWILSHAFLRIVCAHYLHCLPQEIAFCQTDHGKPFIADVSLSFNLSHTRNAFLIAVSHQSVGVDLEASSAVEAVSEVADFCFSEQEKSFVASSDLLRLAVWTAKEAYLKAIGVGLVDNLTQINVAGSSSNIITDSGLAAQTFYCPHGEVATVVYAQTAQTVRFYKCK